MSKQEQWRRIVGDVMQEMDGAIPNSIGQVPEPPQVPEPTAEEFAASLNHSGNQTTTDCLKRDGKEVFTGGGQRNDIGPYAFDALEPEFLRAMAKVMREGQITHGKGNYKKGLPHDDIYKHMFNHMMQWREGDTSENHLAKVACNAMMLMWMEKHKPELAIPLLQQGEEL